MKCQFCSKELREKYYQDHLLRKHPSENASDKRFADKKTIFTYAKPPLNETGKDLNENIPTCVILSASVSTNEDQTSLAFTEKSASFAENLGNVSVFFLPFCKTSFHRLVSAQFPIIYLYTLVFTYWREN